MPSDIVDENATDYMPGAFKGNDMSKEQSEREAFEAKYPGCAKQRDGYDYTGDECRAGWDAWQARAALSESEHTGPCKAGGPCRWRGPGSAALEAEHRKAESERTADATEPTAYFFRFHTDDSLNGKPNVRSWTLQEGKPSKGLYESGEVRLLYDTPPTEAVALLREASDVLHGKGVEDQGDAYDKALRLIDAFLK